jgi:hypothetical protein
MKAWGEKMMEISAIGVGLMMTAMSVAIAGLMLEATLLMLSRALRATDIVASLEPAALPLSQMD